MLIKTFLVQPFYIPSESMEKTLHGCPGCAGDRILVNKPIYDFRDPHPGDIVVFHAPPGWDDEPSTLPPATRSLRRLRGFGQLVGVVPPDEKDPRQAGHRDRRADRPVLRRAGTSRVSDTGPNGPWRSLTSPTSLDGQDSSGLRPGHRARGPALGDGRPPHDSADSRYHCSARRPRPVRPHAQHRADRHGDREGGRHRLAASRWRTLGTPATFESAAAGAAGAALPLGSRPGVTGPSAAVALATPPPMSGARIGRTGARMILFDDRDRVLLIEEVGSDPSGDWHHWLTRVAASSPVSPLLPRPPAVVEEETGVRLVLPPDAQPLGRQRRTWSWQGVTYDQTDHLFAARVSRSFAARPLGLTAMEQQTVVGARWWTIRRAAGQRRPSFRRRRRAGVADRRGRGCRRPRYRPAGRVIVVDPSGAVLLVNVRPDPNAPGTNWITPGGGCEDGETSGRRRGPGAGGGDRHHR